MASCRRAREQRTARRADAGEVADRSGFSYHAILHAIRRGDLQAFEPVPGHYRIELVESPRPHARLGARVQRPAEEVVCRLAWDDRGHSLVYGAVIAKLERRRRYDLYHSALEIAVPDGRFVIEMTPVCAADRTERDVVAGGPVGARWAGRFQIFRSEIRRWRDGSIPDVAEAVDSPRRVIHDTEHAQRLLDLVPKIPTPVWSRGQLNTGDMWNSKSARDAYRVSK